MLWWIDDPRLARRERQQIAALQDEVAWLRNVHWRLTPEMALAFDFDVTHGGEIFPLTLTYAALHPHAPPSVVPRDGRRLSGHQYGAGGTLCLEWRADNWEPTVTGTMIVESAQRLIAGERDEVVREVPSAHDQTVGQLARGETFRFLVTPEVNRYLRALQPGHSIPIEVMERRSGSTFVSSLTTIDGVGGFGAWSYAGRDRIWVRPGRAVRFPLGAPEPETSVTALCAALDDLGFEQESAALAGRGQVCDLLLVSDAGPALFFAFDGEAERLVARSGTLPILESGTRLPEDYAVLGSRRVGIVGCGSLGSKVAVILARKGVRAFTLVDDDVLLPGNLVRNELSELGIGLHKVDALKERLSEVAGVVDVKVRRAALGGQESSAVTESIMSDLSDCDVLIDATADPHCFNFCAAVARAHLRPLVWGQVFGGGIGGFVVRVRPAYEPQPQIARNQLIAWCDSHGVAAPVVSGVGVYGVRSVEGVPLVADDAEVSVIASHLARFASDALVRPDESVFPAPAYVIGLRSEWIFSEPFQTWPVMLSGPADWGSSDPEVTAEERLAILRELMPGSSDADGQSPA